MKRIMLALILAAITFISLTGCVSGNTVEVTVVLKNSTDYELETVIFQIPPTRGSYSPMHYLVEDVDENLKPNDVREIVIHMYESDFGNEGWSIVYVKDDETEYSSAALIAGKDNRFEITCDDEMNFTFAVIKG